MRISSSELLLKTSKRVDPWIMPRMQPTSANFSKIMRTLSIRMLLMWPLEPNEQLTWDQLEIQQAQWLPINSSQGSKGGRKRRQWKLPRRFWSHSFVSNEVYLIWPASGPNNQLSRRIRGVGWLSIIVTGEARWWQMKSTWEAEGNYWQYHLCIMYWLLWCEDTMHLLRLCITSGSSSSEFNEVSWITS